MELAGATSEGREDSLAEESKYTRGVKELSKATNPLVYLDIAGIRDAVVDALEAEELEEYREEVEPFVGPLEAFLLGGESSGDVGRVTITVTIE